MSLFSVSMSECVSAPGSTGIRKTIASVLFAGFLIVLHAATKVSADADALSNRESLGIRADGRDPTDDLVAESVE
jgi:hypothetical protein